METIVEIQETSFSQEVTADEKPVVIEFWIKKFKAVYEHR
jgi:hypothetical protein